MLLKYLFIFAIFSVVGWILEVTYRSITNKKFINPGFLSGCAIPLYGFGVVILNIICIMEKILNYLLPIRCFPLIFLTLHLS